MSRNQLARTPHNEDTMHNTVSSNINFLYSNSLPVYISFDSAGNVGVSGSDPTSPTSSLSVTVPGGTGSAIGVCARTGVTFTDGKVDSRGTCECKTIAKSPAAAKAAGEFYIPGTTSGASYVIQAGAEKSGYQTYTIVSISSTGDLDFNASTGEIHIGNGGGVSPPLPGGRHGNRQ